MNDRVLLYELCGSYSVDADGNRIYRVIDAFSYKQEAEMILEREYLNGNGLANDYKIRESTLASYKDFNKYKYSLIGNSKKIYTEKEMA